MDIPDNTRRIAVIGRTGTGKTQGAVYLLGRLLNSTWSNMPVTIVDFKRARLLAKLGAKELKIGSKPPTKPGLYIIRPAPVDDNQAVLDYLRAVYHQTHHALFFDEVLELGLRNPGFRRLLTQGRELRIPMMYCMQRPAWVDVYSLSEADFFMTFDLRNKDDVMKVQKFAPGYNPDKLDRFYSYWYDVASDRGAIMRPVPSESVTLQGFRPHTAQPGEARSNTRVLL